MISLPKHVWLSLGFALSLTGCSDGGIDEISGWMAETKRNTKVFVKPLAEPKKFTPFVYDVKATIDPYNPGKLAVAFAKAQSASQGGFKPNLDRRREAMENFPLDSIKMVGTLQKQGLSYALLQVDRTVYQAKVGNHVGQNFGMVTRITDTEIELKEIVQDAAGDWVERVAKLELQETTK